jgi:restriction endonuclease S subunit
MTKHLHGATMKHVNRGEFLATQIPLPPLAEQQRIAALLDTADRILKQRESAIAKLDQLAQSLFVNIFKNEKDIKKVGDLFSINMNKINVKLKELLNKYDIHLEGNVSSHMFRKTLGNRALKLNNYSNESMVLLMELFNHSSPTTTKLYLGVRDSEIQSIYDSLKL